MSAIKHYIEAEEACPVDNFRLFRVLYHEEMVNQRFLE